jgi:hypothetical protein
LWFNGGRRGGGPAPEGGGHGGSGAAAAQPGCGGARLGLKRTKASGAWSSGREGGVAGLVAEEVGWTAWAGRQAKAGGVGRPAGLNSVEKKIFSNKKLDF